MPKGTLIDKYKAIFFDHDDTLVATIEAKWAHHRYVAKTYYGKDISDAELRLHWGKPLSKLVSLIHSSDNYKEVFDYLMASQEDFPKKLFEQTIPTLKYLHKQGKLIGVITATSRLNFEHDLAFHKMPKSIIDYSQTEDDTDFHKPDPKVFQPAILWLSDRKIKPQEVLYVGDGLHDMKAAIGAGFNFIGVCTGLVNADEFLAEGAVSVSGVGDLVK